MADLAEHQLIHPERSDWVILLPPWHNGGIAYDNLANRLARQGLAVSQYKFNDVLSADVEGTAENQQTAAEQVVFDTDLFRTRYQPERLSLIATSLGGATGMLALSKGLKADRVTFIVPGYSVAAGVWHGKRTRQLRQQLESDRVTEEGLEAAWDKIKPINYVNHLAGVPTEVYLGAKDTHIPYAHGQKMATALTEAGAKLNLRSYRRLGHYSVSLAYYYGILAGSRQSTVTTK